MARVLPTTWVQICGRKNCSRCGRWLIIAINFKASKRDEEGEVLYVGPHCTACRREYDRELNQNLSPLQLAKRRSNKRAWYRKHHKTLGSKPLIEPAVRRPNTVERLPFAYWLQEKITEIGIVNVAYATGLDPRLIYSYLRGYEYVSARGNRRGYNRAIDFVEIATVDRALTLYGEPPDTLKQLYPMS